MTRLALLFAAVLSGVGLAACTTTTVTSSASGEVVEKNMPPRPNLSTPDNDPRSRARTRTELASSYYRNGQLGVALEEARRAISIDPGYAPAHSLLGLVQMDLGQKAEADDSFRRSLALEPANPELANNYGWFLCRTGREREGVTWFDRAARDPLYATPARALTNAGVCLMQIRDFEGAEQALRRSFELDAGAPLTRYQLARAYVALNQPERAEFYFRLLTAGGEQNAQTLWLGVRIARLSGDLRRESQLARELQDRFPRSAEAARLRQGDFNE